MNVYVVLGICFIPLIVVFTLVKIFTKIKLSHSVIAVLLGLLSVIPITFLQYVITDLMPQSSFLTGAGIFWLFVKVLIFAGLLEEGMKFVVELLIPRKKLNVKQFMGACLIFGITLGCFESVVYFLNHLQKANMKHADLIYSMIFMRMGSSDIIHCACAAISGFTIYSIKQHRFYISPVITAILIHGLFDLFVYFENEIKWFGIAAVLLSIIEVRVKYQVVKDRENQSGI